jgi:hypothetical protein
MVLDPVSTRGRQLVYVVLAVQVALIAALAKGWVAGAVPLAGYWLLTWALIIVIRRTERAVHPEQTGWWTWIPLLLGTWGLLMWLRHLDHEHNQG